MFNLDNHTLHPLHLIYQRAHSWKKSISHILHNFAPNLGQNSCSVTFDPAFQKTIGVMVVFICFKTFLCM